ncbi:MAG: hypothetical protein GY719_04450 [bacterium]|nr:hypothetical protein [bacterium]
MRRFVIAALALSMSAAPAALGDELYNCEMEFDLRSWSAFVKKARGSGTVTCENGQSARVEIRVRGGGLTFGKSEIVNGKAKISGVKDISEVFGSYASASAHAGVGPSAEATAMTKGEVSLALAGTGRGIDLGVAFSKFKILRAK